MRRDPQKWPCRITIAGLELTRFGRPPIDPFSKLRQRGKSSAGSERNPERFEIVDNAGGQHADLAHVADQPIDRSWPAHRAAGYRRARNRNHAGNMRCYWSRSGGRSPSGASVMRDRQNDDALYPSGRYHDRRPAWPNQEPSRPTSTTRAPTPTWRRISPTSSNATSRFTSIGCPTCSTFRAFLVRLGSMRTAELSRKSVTRINGGEFATAIWIAAARRENAV